MDVHRSKNGAAGLNGLRIARVCMRETCDNRRRRRRRRSVGISLFRSVEKRRCRARARGSRSLPRVGEERRGEERTLTEREVDAEKSPETTGQDEPFSMILRQGCRASLWPDERFSIAILDPRHIPLLLLLSFFYDIHFFRYPRERRAKILSFIGYKFWKYLYIVTF